MAAQPRKPWGPRKLWPAGEYTLLADSHTTKEGVKYSKGDTLDLDDRQATRLGNAGTIAYPSCQSQSRRRAGLDTPR